jgi:hypothetical protein
MIVHALTVGIYLLSLFLFILVFTMNKNTLIYTTYILEIFCNRLTQVMICYIFWNMDSIKFVPVPAASHNADQDAV